MLDAIPRERIVHEWGLIALGLRRIKEPAYNEMELFAEAQSGELIIWRIEGGYLAGKIKREKGTMRRFLRINYVCGTSEDFWKQARSILSEIEDMARRNKLIEIRFEGRKGFSRLFPDYTRTPTPNGVEYRKAL